MQPEQDGEEGRKHSNKQKYGGRLRKGGKGWGGDEVGINKDRKVKDDRGLSMVVHSELEAFE